MKRYSVVPIDLFRFQSAKLPKLRQYHAQQLRGLRSFDFKLGSNNLYNPVQGDIYLGPNGLSLRPIGGNLAEFLSSFKGKYIYQLSKDLVIPSTFVLIHEHTDHFSLQTKQPIEPSQYCKKVMQFLEKQKKLTIQQMNQKVSKIFKF